MNLFEAFKIGLNMIRLHKLRAFLTMLGVIIGVMSVSLIVLIFSAFQSYIKSEVARLGSDVVFIAFAPSLRGQGESLGSVGALQEEDVQYLMDRVPEIGMASASREAGRKTVKVGQKEVKEVGLTGVDANRFKRQQAPLLRGRFFSDSDFSDRNNVTLITEEVEEGLFGKGKGLGKQVLVDGTALDVIGIMRPEEFLGSRDGKAMLMPLSTLNSKLMGESRVDVILCWMNSDVDINKGMDRIWEALMLKSGNRQLYRVDSTANLQGFLSNIIGVAGFALAGVAALSLLVGGIGIMNIMLVSVTERTKEIGLRKALGAKKGSILSQFLTESATLSLVGGLIGMSIAWAFGLAITLLTQARAWPNEQGLAAPFPWTAAIGAAIFSALIGCIFGFYPAYRAARLEPIVALRAE